MTRLAVLADIHGNLPALEAVLADLAQFEVDHVVIAGDVINWGPSSAEVMARVAERGWGIVRGNNEFYLLDYDTPRAPESWRDRSQFQMLPWLYRQLRGRWHHMIAVWPDSLSLRFPDAPPVRVVHGSPRSAWEPIYPQTGADDVAEMLAGIEETTIIAGHTHLPMDRQVAGRHIVNPGSVGVPIDGTFSASYMLLEGNADGWRPAFRRVDFDYDELFA